MKLSTPAWTRNIPLNVQIMIPVIVSLILFAIVAIAIASSVSVVSNNINETNKRVILSDALTKVNIDWMQIRVQGRDTLRSPVQSIDDNYNKLKIAVDDIKSLVENDLIGSEIISDGGRASTEKTLPLMELYTDAVSQMVANYKQLQELWDSAPYLSMPLTTLMGSDTMDGNIDWNDKKN